MGVCVTGAAWVMGILVAGFGEQSKKIMIEFLIRGYVGWCAKAERAANQAPTGDIPRGDAGARTCPTDSNASIVSLR